VGIALSRPRPRDRKAEGNKMSFRLDSHACAAAVAAALAAVLAAFQTARAEAPFAAAPGAQRPKPRVRARILADADAVRAGRDFLLGVLLQIEPTWHVYWKNPGDAGLATEVRFALPKGFSAQPLNWPIPVRFDQPGDIVGYGYEKAVLLWARVTPPKKLPPHPAIVLAADVSWLACGDICVPGEAKLKLELPVAGADNKGVGGSADTFARWRARLPAPAASADRRVTATVGGKLPRGPDAGSFRITLDWKGPVPNKIQWFPGPIGGVEIAKAAIRTNGRQTRVSFSARVLAGGKLSAKVLESLVVYTGADGARRAVRVPVQLVGRRGGKQPTKPKTDAKDGESDKPSTEPITRKKKD